MSIAPHIDSMDFNRIHARALEASSRYKRAEAELVEILQQVEHERVFIKRGHASLFAYVTSELGLGESTAYTLITVARKAREVPQLMEALGSGQMTLSNARRVASVLTPENQQEWLQKARELSNRRLEKEIAQARPEDRVQERASYVSGDRIKLVLGLSEREMLRLRRAQDLLCQARQRPVSLEETIVTLTSEYLERNDPVNKAKRNRVKHGSSHEKNGRVQDTARDPASTSTENAKSRLTSEDELVTRREAIPAATLHQVYERDQGRCAHILPNGLRCNQARWLEIHHRVPVSQGGTNSPENLITLCRNHHEYWHLQMASSAGIQAARVSP